MDIRQINEKINETLIEIDGEEYDLPTVNYNGTEYWTDSDELEDESYAGGIWDLAHDFLANNDVYSEELQDALYNLIKYDILKI
ncbi:MAG: hypothetical protein K6E29_01120 [Cyanobacteria bacterium RUI128]|nr:hypothetical protein [Cyanobacteria bacterium RUI128]